MQTNDWLSELVSRRLTTSDATERFIGMALMARYWEPAPMQASEVLRARLDGEFLTPSQRLARWMRERSPEHFKMLSDGLFLSLRTLRDSYHDVMDCPPCDETASAMAKHLLTRADELFGAIEILRSFGGGSEALDELVKSVEDCIFDLKSFFQRVTLLDDEHLSRIRALYPDCEIARLLRLC